MTDINFSPFATNVLDMMEKPLSDHNGRTVIIRTIGTAFAVIIDDKKAFESWDNISVSYFLNCLGVYEKAPAPVEYPMVEGEGAPQYTFFTPANTQLSLF